MQPVTVRAKARTSTEVAGVRMCPKHCIVDATGHGTREARTSTEVAGVRMCPKHCIVDATGHGTREARTFPYGNIKK